MIFQNIDQYRKREKKWYLKPFIINANSKCINKSEDFNGREQFKC